MSSSYEAGAMCPVFRPTREEFDVPFCEYVRKVFRKHPDMPMFKVVPPKGWRPRRAPFPDLRNVQINVPIRQNAFGTKGAYRCVLVEQKPMTVAEFKVTADEEVQRLSAGRACAKGGAGADAAGGAAGEGGRRASNRATSARNFRPPVEELPQHGSQKAAAGEEEAGEGRDLDAVDPDVERSFWSNLTLNPPLYGADTPVSFFDEKLPYGWNLNHLGDLLQTHPKVDAVPGVTTPMTYFGMWRSFFGWHKEDADLYSVNFLHWGAPKVWYCVPPSGKQKFERMAQSLFPELHKSCPAFVRHKDIMMSPSCLKTYGVPYMRACQRANEFVVLNAAAYHAGFNSGFNCAEAVNFGLKEWIPIGKEAVPCRCSALKDVVRISMKLFDPKWVDPYETPSESDSEPESSDFELSEDEEAAAAAAAGATSRRRLVAGRARKAAVRRRKAQAADFENEESSDSESEDGEEEEEEGAEQRSEQESSDEDEETEAKPTKGRGKAASATAAKKGKKAAAAKAAAKVSKAKATPKAKAKTAAAPAKGKAASATKAKTTKAATSAKKATTTAAKVKPAAAAKKKAVAAAVAAKRSGGVKKVTTATTAAKKAATPSGRTTKTAAAIAARASKVEAAAIRAARANKRAAAADTDGDGRRKRARAGDDDTAAPAAARRGRPLKSATADAGHEASPDTAPPAALPPVELTADGRHIVTAVKPRSTVNMAALALKVRSEPGGGTEAVMGQPMAIVGDAENGGSISRRASAAAPLPEAAAAVPAGAAGSAPPTAPAAAAAAAPVLTSPAVDTSKRFFYLVQRLARPAPTPGHVLLRWLKEGRDGLFRPVAGSVWEEVATALLPVHVQPVCGSGSSGGAAAAAAAALDVVGTDGNEAPCNSGDPTSSSHSAAGASGGGEGKSDAKAAEPEAWRLMTPREQIVDVELRRE